MSAPQWSLLATRRFWPLFVTQFLGAFNDNLFRFSMLFLVSFGARTGGGGDRAALIGVLSGAVFTLPFFLFSSLAGQLADRIDKARIARMVKVAELAIMAAGAIALDTGSLPLLMAVVFAMGTHSTVFGPVKYAILPQHLKPGELLGGTGLVEAATFLAILAGQLLGGLLEPSTLGQAGRHVTAGEVMLGAALLGLIASRFIPPAPPPGRHAPIEANLVRSTARIVRHACANRPLFHAILGITWFFALGAVLTQQFAPLVAGFNGTPAVGALLVGLFSIGVAIGSMLVGRLLGGTISARHGPVAALVVAIGTIDLGWTVRGLPRAPSPADVAGFYRMAGSGRLTVDLLAIAIAAGVYIVPLYALLQTLGDAANRSRDVAANNIVNAAGMVALLGIASAVLAAGLSSADLFLILGTAGLGVAAASFRARRDGDRPQSA